MASFGLRNPALILSKDLPASDITTLNYCTSAKGVFDTTTPQQMHQAILKYGKVCDSKTLALFFHGGLVSKESGMATARQLYGPYSASSDPDDLAGDAYPYFFVWESGLAETLSHNLPGIVGETIFQRIRDIVGDKALRILGAEPKTAEQIASLRAPFLDVQVQAEARDITVSQEDIDEVQRAVENDPLINAAKRQIAASARPAEEALLQSVDTTPRAVRTSDATLLSPEIVNAIVAEETHKTFLGAKTQVMGSPFTLGLLALGAGEVLVRIIRRYATGRNHNFHNTLVEEIFRKYYVANIGWAVWNEMKVKTAEAFQGNASVNVGTAMIQELLALYESGARGRNARVTLLGHSTGAVYICNFLAAMASALHGKPYAADIRFDIIFMAPAVRVDVLAPTIAKFGGMIRNFRAFEMSDELESAEILLQFDGWGSVVNPILAQIYTSSLLYFISGSLEDKDDDTPLNGMNRFFLRNGAFSPGKFLDIDAIQSFYDSKKNAVVLSDTRAMTPQPPLGKRCTSHHHGGFPNDDTPARNGSPHAGGTLQSVCYLLKTGNYT